MEPRPPFYQTPFDMLVTPDVIQILKLMLPYMPLRLQRVAGTCAKFSELQNAIYYFQPPFDSVCRTGRLRQKEFTAASVMEDLRPWLPAEVSENMEMVFGAMEMMESMQSMPEGEGMDMEEMVKQMLMSQERMDMHERMDGEPVPEESGSGEAGADSYGGQPDKREDRQESGAGHDVPDNRGEPPGNPFYAGGNVPDSGYSKGRKIQ